VSFDIRQLRYAIAAADHGSFYRAPRALDIEQSTLSCNILKLERIPRDADLRPIARGKMLGAGGPDSASASGFVAHNRARNPCFGKMFR
jgi:Bacterial regulatory helix-turn-helix protein, lysR family